MKNWTWLGRCASFLGLLPVLGLLGALAGWPDTGSTPLLWRSLQISALASLIALLWGSSISLLLAIVDLPGRRMWGLLALLPLLWPPYLLAIALLQWTGDFLCHPPGVALVLGWWGSPLVAFPGLLALQRISRSLVEAASLQRSWTWLWGRLVLPQLLPFWLAGAILVFVLSSQEYGVASLLMVNCKAGEVFALLDGYRDRGAAFWAAFPLALLGCSLLGVLAWLWQGRLRPRLRPLQGPCQSWRLGGWRWAALPLALLLTAPTLLPLLTFAGRVDPPQLIWLAYWEAGDDVLTSLAIALATACLALLWGVALASGWRDSAAWFWLALAPLSLPPSLLALAWLAVPLPDWPLSQGSLLVALQALRLAGITACLLGAAYSSNADLLADFVRLSGRGWRHLFWAPHRPTLVLAWSLVFFFSLGDLTLNLLLTPPGMGTLGPRIFNLQHYGRPDLVAALSLTLMAMAVTPWLAAVAWNEWRRS